MFTITAQAMKKSALKVVDALIIAVSISILLPLLLLSIIIPSLSTSHCSDFQHCGAVSA